MKKNINSLQSLIPQYKLPEESLSVIEKSPGTDRQYLGQPDMIMLDDEETLMTVYPIGHGAGPIVMQVSKDGGKTWREKTDTPHSWRESLETPTIYKLRFRSGRTKLLLISGRPNWHGNERGGWQTSISDDHGVTWSEFQTIHSTLRTGSENWTTVAMASLIQLKDANGEWIDQWMGVYHNEQFINYQTFLTFDAEGNAQWSEPKPYLKEHRDKESEYKICEVGLFRSPDGNTITALGRAQSHQHESAIFHSTDEGRTWTEPLPAHPSIRGERHKAAYDPISGRLVITFREILFSYDENGRLLADEWLAGDWVAWVGTYETLIEKTAGDYVLKLAEDWTNTPKSGDTGYAGIVVKTDGTFILDSYGHWDKEFSKTWTEGVLTDLCYIIQATFKLTDIETRLRVKKH